MGPFDAIGLAVVCLAVVKIIQFLSQAIVSAGRGTASRTPSCWQTWTRSRRDWPRSRND